MNMDHTRIAFTIESVAGTRYTVYRRPHAGDQGGSSTARTAIGFPTTTTLTTYGGRAVKAYTDETYRVDGSGEIFRLAAGDADDDNFTSVCNIAR
jgi:hypothetical protein